MAMVDLSVVGPKCFMWRRCMEFWVRATVTQTRLPEMFKTTSTSKSVISTFHWNTLEDMNLEIFLFAYKCVTMARIRVGRDNDKNDNDKNDNDRRDKAHL